MRFSDKIMTLRKQRGWSQEDLANQLDVSRQAIYKWESGLTTPELEKIKKLTEIFDTSFEELLNDDKEISSNKKEAELSREDLSDIEEQIPDEAENIVQSAPTAYAYAPENETNTTGTGQERKRSLSPSGRGKLLGIIALAVGAVALTALIIILILHLCEPNPDGEESSSSSEGHSSIQEVEGANCKIQIMSGESEDIKYKVKLTEGQGFKLEAPDFGMECVVFKGYFTEDGTQITNSEGDSLVNWQGEERYILYPHYEYKIKTVDDLVALQGFAPVKRADTYSCVKITLENDLDLSEIEDWEPLRIYPCLDGKGHTIKNLTSTKGGLFGDIYASSDKYIKNLTLENVNITIEDIPSGSNNLYVGTLCGWFQGSIENVQVTSGKITLSGDIANKITYNVLCPYARKIENSESKATIEMK